MPTYYEILKVSPTASVTEIQAALDAQYNHWRRLVTHHDPQVAQRANQALLYLEQVRVTLTDSQKRSQYNSSLQLTPQNTSGLADHTVKPQPLTPPSPLRPPQPHTQTPPISTQRVDAWICPKCQKANPIGTKFCKGCGLALGMDCPKCGKLTEVIAPFCAECGANINETSRQKQIQDEFESKNWLPIARQKLSKPKFRTLKTE